MPDRVPPAVGKTWLVPSFTLVHSPLVGPATWSRVGEELSATGHHVAIPSLVGAASTGSWNACVVAAVAGACAADRLHVLVGHSGAGPLLPVIASLIEPRPDLLVFVDAGVPPREHAAVLMPQQFLDHLRTLTSDGQLPKWSDWFGPARMESLLPNRAERNAIVAELPTLPLAYFEESVPMPSRWTDFACAYILLTDSYRQDAEEARVRGWPVVELPGNHLDIVNRPGDIADALLAFVTPADGAPGAPA